VLVFPMWVASILGSTNIGDAAGAVSRSQSYSGGANGAVEARSTGENTAPAHRIGASSVFRWEPRVLGRHGGD
jgi:hypothetical protein